MKIKKKYKIGAHWFNVLLESGDRGFIDSGYKSSWKQIIVLQKEMAQSQKEVCLIHEVVHEIDFQNRLNLSEGVVSTLASGIYQFLVDNNLIV